MTSKLDQSISIAKQIVDGSITINSIDEFKSILRILPSDPALHRGYADLLARKKSHSAAVRSYSRAATLNIEAGMMLQAIICKILEWRLKKPKRQRVRRFYNTLSSGNYHQAPLNEFLINLAFDEFTALVNQMTRVRLAAGKTIRKIGDPQAELYLIVSGNLKATTLLPLSKTRSKPRNESVFLTENDFFGDIYPYDSSKISQTFVETITAAELVKISKAKLRRVSRKYPNIELGLIDLFKARSENGEGGLLRKVRQLDRHLLPIKVEIQIFPGNSDDHPIVLDGYTRDVSIGGMCVVLDPDYAHVPSMYQKIKRVQVRLSMPGDAMTIGVAGKIVWSRQVADEGRKTVALGLQYRNMPPKLSGLLVVFADILHGTNTTTS